MNNQHPQEALLLAYVDGRLEGERREKARKLIRSDAQAREFVEMLERTKLPYEEAFDAGLDRSIPDNLQNTIDSWTPPSEMPLAGKRASRRFGLVAALVIGVGVGFAVSQWSQTGSSDRHTPEWLAQVASYHELYVRDTVAGTGISAAERTLLVDRLAAALEAPLQIPDLAQQNLDFKRGQLLQIDGRALIQLAYLPDAGTPVALCITKNGAPDTGFNSGESHNLNYVNWARGGVSYVILGALAPETLTAAAKSAAAQLL